MRHALIIEDNWLIAMMIERQLEEQGFLSVTIARSQEEAISAAQERCPDFITVDDWLDEGSGVDAIRHICRDMAIPVVFITASPEDIAARIPDAVVVPKPIPPGAMRAGIRAALQNVRTYT
jgi:DNA-binding response OmpR family regulator